MLMKKETHHNEDMNLKSFSS